MKINFKFRNTEREYSREARIQWKELRNYSNLRDNLYFKFFLNDGKRKMNSES